MNEHSLVLADQERLQQFFLVGDGPRLLKSPQCWRDAEGIPWAAIHLGDHCFAATPLGPGWVFDSYALAQQKDKVEAREVELASASAEQLEEEGRAALHRVRLGGHAERLLWAIHRAVLSAQASLLIVPDFLLAKAVWGRVETARPRHWRQELLTILEGLTWLHLASWPETGAPVLGSHSVVLTHVADLRGRSEDACSEACPGQGLDRHHHYLINVGRGLLGVLEAFAQGDDSSGIRSYNFPMGGGRASGPSLRRIGKTGKVVSVYLPARLGQPDRTRHLTTTQHRLLQALLREITRERPSTSGQRSRGRRSGPTAPETLQGYLVPDAHGRRFIACPALDKGDRYVGFNGNKKLHGRGYRLMTEGGWLAKAGYAKAESERFLDDLTPLKTELGVVAVGLSPTKGEWIALERMRDLARTPPGQRLLDQLHVRVYASADYLERWGAFFGVREAATVPGRHGERLLTLQRRMDQAGLTQRLLASRLDLDTSFLSKLLRGRKPWPDGLLEKALAAAVEPCSTGRAGCPPDVLSAAQDYLRRGWSVVPQQTAAKKPLIRWKPYQQVRPSETDLMHWLQTWPEAGLAVILGPVSGLFVIDVDGTEAEAELQRRLGSIPLVPKVLSGSRDPSRYHLYFRDPGLPTKAKATPWHPKLEFRGNRGIVIAPPSRHKSGHRYEWASGQGLDDLPLPEVPAMVLEALQPKSVQPRSITVRVESSLPPEKVVSPSTRLFLSGAYANGPKWNDRLFRAACDLAGREWEQEEAEPLLLGGAQPWNADEEEAARRTIQSAFNQPRTPGEV